MKTQNYWKCNKTLTDERGNTSFVEGGIYQQKPSHKASNTMLLIDANGGDHFITHREDEDNWIQYFEQVYISSTPINTKPHFTATLNPEDDSLVIEYPNVKMWEGSEECGASKEPRIFTREECEADDSESFDSHGIFFLRMLAYNAYHQNWDVMA